MSEPTEGQWLEGIEELEPRRPVIDRTQLTEALDHAEHWLALHTDTEKQVMVEAARWARDFPTDEQVEAGLEAWLEAVEVEDFSLLDAFRAALEAVTMIGDGDEA